MKFRIKTLGVFLNICRVLAGTVFFALFSSSALAQDYQMSVGDDYGAIVDDSGNLFLWGSAQTDPGGITQVFPAEAWQSGAVSRTSAA